ncbi:hypothetical protein [Intrasporangium sp. DVR]|uniref:hypothetical protein n=1 Tax=Intrasporangium sp. DVR TaxID=3127867 RepID=UPI00334102A0
MDPPDAGSAVTGSMGRDASHLLEALRHSMEEAREAVMEARRVPAAHTQLERARSDYLLAMLAYQRALTVYRLPTPPRLRDELRLLRSLTTSADPATLLARRPAPWVDPERSRRSHRRGR